MNNKRKIRQAINNFSSAAFLNMLPRKEKKKRKTAVKVTYEKIKNSGFLDKSRCLYIFGGSKEENAINWSNISEPGFKLTFAK